MLCFYILLLHHLCWMHYMNLHIFPSIAWRLLQCIACLLTAAFINHSWIFTDWLRTGRISFWWKKVRQASWMLSCNTNLLPTIKQRYGALIMVLRRRCSKKLRGLPSSFTELSAPGDRLICQLSLRYMIAMCVDHITWYGPPGKILPLTCIAFCALH